MPSRVSGCSAGCLLAPRDRMGPGPDAGSLIHPGCPADGFARTLAAAWLDAPFRSGRAVRLRRVCRDALAIPCDDQHESQRDPYDNAACESFMKTLKYEEVYRNEYRDLPEARASIGQFLDRFITKSGYTTLSAMCRQRNSSNREAVHDPITARPAALGALPPNPRDLPPSGQNVSSFRRRPRPPPRHSGCRVGARVASPLPA